MATLKRFGPGSALKLGAITYAFVGLVIGIIMACASLVAGALTGMDGSGMGMRALGYGMGVWAVIVAPIVYGIIGGIGAGSGRWCTTLRLAGWAASRWTSANRSMANY